MLSELAQKSELYQTLYQIDQDLAEEKRKNGCTHCNGPLHKADYQRKPRGGPDLDDKFNTRRSWCCGNKDCRRRTKPLSILFLGRRVYWGCVILIVTALRQSRETGFTIEKLMAQFGVSRSTLKRWFAYFRMSFPMCSTWKKLRDQLSSILQNHQLPKELPTVSPDRNQGIEAIKACLEFLTGAFENIICNPQKLDSSVRNSSMRV